MVTAPMMQRGMEVALPESRRAQAVTDERVFVTVPLSYRDDGRVMVGEETVELAVLDERIRQELLTRSDKNVWVRSDGALQIQILVDVMDELRDGGVENMTVVTDVPRQR
jgi:biopolymer transport protein ExbD/biopolymer transport protein TolR